jgi:hypothetical protein
MVGLASLGQHCDHQLCAHYEPLKELTEGASLLARQRIMVTQRLLRQQMDQSVCLTVEDAREDVGDAERRHQHWFRAVTRWTSLLDP